MCGCRPVQAGPPVVVYTHTVLTLTYTSYYVAGWSFNYNKNRKGCWLMSTGDSDARTQSNTGFDSGYRECAPSDADLTWSNDPIDFGAPADTQG